MCGPNLPRENFSIVIKNQIATTKGPKLFHWQWSKPENMAGLKLTGIPIQEIKNMCRQASRYFDRQRDNFRNWRRRSLHFLGQLTVVRHLFQESAFAFGWVQISNYFHVWVQHEPRHVPTSKSNQRKSRTCQNSRLHLCVLSESNLQNFDSNNIGDFNPSSTHKLLERWFIDAYILTRFIFIYYIKLMNYFGHDKYVIQSSIIVE